MANREACELYIEQEMQEGLNQGKTPYSIGQELSGWIVKLFEVRIKPDTLKKRAQRQQEKIRTNVPNDLTPENDSEKEQIQEFKWGGKREGAGRKQKAFKAVKVSGAMAYAYSAILALEKIKVDDPQRRKALLFVKQWIEDKMKKYSGRTGQIG